MTMPAVDLWTSLHCFLHWDTEQNDAFLTDAAGPLLAGLRADGLLEDWFFIRYGEGGPHVRIRARAVRDPEALQLSLASLIGGTDLPGAEGWTPHGTVSEIAYEPEIERYGGVEAISVAEEVFCRSSEIVLEALSGSSASRMNTALPLMYATALGLGLDERAGAAWLRKHAAAWRLAADTPKLPPAVPLARSEAMLARQRDKVLGVLTATRATVRDGEGLAARWAATVAHADAELAEQGVASGRRLAVWASQLHMLCNRLGVQPDEERALCWVLAGALAPEAGLDQRYLESSKYPPGQLPELGDDEGGDRTADHPGWLATTVPLPAGPALEMPLGQAIRERRSCRDYTGPVAATTLGALLRESFGGRDRPETGGWATRNFPSAGSKYSVRLRLIAWSVDGLAPGTYGVGRHGDRLYRYADAPDRAEATATSMWFATTRPPAHQLLVDLAQVPAMLALTVHTEDLRAKYGLRALRFALLEAGHVAQNLALAATGLGLGTILVGGFYDDLVHELFAVDGVNEIALYLLPLGVPADVSR
ncbi:thiopeptide-type bacteriocin biosynthesis protein [Microtetraspora malaysiensis]|uniref:thiopeptide-type bacteriocin biosynthesis protein n=1 Tax=Microtetraspora malaysiensis TaxID=161358 RepID=UPI003D8D5C9D